MDGLRMGGDAIEQSLEEQKSGGSDFKPFLSNIYWDEDKQEKYVLILTPINPIDPEDEDNEAGIDVWGSPKLDIIRIFEPKPNMIVSKTDPVVGDRSDRFEDVWDAIPRTTNLAVAVVLEAIEEEVKGRPSKVRGFKVATREFSRKVKDEDGNSTDESEDVEAPEIGIIAQSPANFFGILKHKNDTEFPIHETPMKITRFGEKANTQYEFKGYEDIEVDLSGLIDNLGALSYLGDTTDELLDKIDGLDPAPASLVIGDHLLKKRVDELLDDDIYDELFEGITKTMDTFNQKKKGKDSKKAAPVARSSQRKTETKTPDEASTEEKLSKLKAKAAA